MVIPTTHAYNTLPATSNVILPQTNSRTIHADNLAWLDASPGVMPDNVISTISVDGKSIYICNAKAFGGVQPGIVTDHGCLITYNGAAIFKKNFKVLTGTAKLVWKDPSVMYADQSTQSASFYGVLAKGMNIDVSHYAPVIGGYESQSPNYLHPLYICRTLATDAIQVGKVVGSNCNIAVRGKEVVEPNYQVLSIVVGTKNASQANINSDAPIKDKPRALMFD